MVADPTLVFSRLHPDDLPGIWQAIAEAYAGPTEFEWEGRLITQAGGIKWIRCTSSPEVLENGDVIFNGLITDINEKKQADEEIRKLNLDLQERVDRLALVNQELESLTQKLELACDAALEASKLKSEFVANISHEIRTPISAVIGMSELLLDTVLDSQQKQFTTMVKDSAQSLLAIINDILDFSKVEAGRVELDNVDFNILSLLEDCADLLGPAARKKDLALLTWIDPRLPATLCGDPVRIRQILLNLASNAVKFTRRGEVVLKAELEIATQSEEGLVTVKFTVTDTGIGLSQSTRNRLFSPFVQADGSTTRKYGGTGLGLSISKLLVEMMSGSIDFTSEANKGSSFWFAIPIGLAQDRATLKQILAPRAQLICGSQSGNYSEDSASEQVVFLFSRSLDLQEIVASYLSIYGVKVRVVNTLDRLLSLLSEANGRAQEACQLREARLMIYDMAMGRDLSDVKSAAEGLDTTGQNVISGNYLQMSSTHEIDSFQRFVRAISSADGQNLPGLIVLGGNEMPNVGAFASSSSYIGHLQKPFRLFEFLSEVEKSYTGASNHQAVLSAVAPSLSSFASSALPKLIQSNVISGQRILIAEDNTVMQELALRQVQRLGLVADLVANGKEALAAFRSGLYSLILMDCQMPEMDGYEATLLIRKDESVCGGHIPVIAMTASAMKGDRENCIAAGMDDYLSKPVGQEQLFRLLEKWLLPHTVGRGGEIPGKHVSELNLLAERPLEEIPINCEELAALYGLGDLKRLINSFSAECEELLSGIRLAVEGRNESETIRLAHQLKGLAVVMTADALSRSALALETSAKRGEVDQLPALTESLEQELATVLAYIESRKGSAMFS
jgi:signal transduction histidine kinase/CheY-like chemotaxis protein